MEAKKSSFQFERPILLNLIYNENSEFELKDEIKIKVDLETNVDTGENDTDADVYVTLKTIGDDLPFYIEAEMYSKFTWDKEFKNENMQKILKTNAASVLVSYIRNIVANITSSSRYPTWHIPFLDLRKENDD